MITQKIIARTDSLKLDKIISRYGEDSMRQVVFIIVRPDPESEELIPITIPEDAVGSFRILKPSGNFVIVPMNKSVLASGETAFDVVLPASANTSKGSGYYDIRITSETDKYYFTAQGDFLVDDNIISDEVLEDVSEVNGLIFPDDFFTIEDHVAYIDDDTISTDSTWSSNKINEEIEAHAGGDVSKTVSGNPIEISDGASAPLVKCVTEIQGSQDLHGYDKPWVGGAGKNKLTFTIAGTKAKNTSGTWNGNTYSYNGRTFILNSLDGVSVSSVGISGVPSGYPNLTTDDFSLPVGTYNFYFNIRIRIYKNGTQIADSTTSPYSLTIDNSTDVYSVVIFPGNSEIIGTEQIYCYLSTETITTFAPYSNICPITAYTEGEIDVRGKNLFDKDDSDISTGRALNAQTGASYPATNWSVSDFIKIESSTTYALNAMPSSSSSVAFYDSNKTYISGAGSFETKTTPSNAKYLRFDYKTEYSAIMQLEEGSTATTYEPYTSTTHTTTFPSAIFRGSEDVVNGEVITEWGMIASYAGETLPNEWISDRDEYAPGTTPTTGAQVAYKLAVPTTSSVTPTHLPIKSLSGYTHIESTTGEMEIEYITQRFQPLFDSIKQL